MNDESNEDYQLRKWGKNVVTTSICVCFNTCPCHSVNVSTAQRRARQASKFFVQRNHVAGILRTTTVPGDESNIGWQLLAL